MGLFGNFPHEIEHARPTYVESDGNLGGERRVLKVIAEGISCWVQNATQREIEQHSKRDELITHKVYFENPIDLRPGDAIHVTSGPSFVGLLCNHKTISDATAGLGVVFKAFVEQENNLRPAEWIPLESSSSSSESSASLSVSSASSESSSSSTSSQSSSSTSP